MRDEWSEAFINALKNRDTERSAADSKKRIYITILYWEAPEALYT